MALAAFWLSRDKKAEKIHVGHYRNMPSTAKPDDSRLKEIPVQRAKHIGPPIERGVNHWIVVRIGKNNRFADHKVHKLSDSPQKIDMLFHLLLSQPVASQQTRVAQHARRLVQDEFGEDQLVRTTEKRVQNHTRRSLRFSVRSHQNAGIQHDSQGR